MKLLKKAAILGLFVMALSGCTQSSISTDVPVAAPGPQGEAAGPQAGPVGPGGPGQEIEEEEEVDARLPLIDEEALDQVQTIFDWEQVESDAKDMFEDASFYPQTVAMTYEGDEEAKAIKLMWTLKNGTAEEEGMTYATELVRMFNDILAVQVVEYEMADVDNFGGVWKDFALTVQVSTEDGTMLVDKSYAAGAEIDLVLPKYDSNGPGSQGPATDDPTAKKPGDK